MEIWIVHSHFINSKIRMHGVWAFKSYRDAWNYATELKDGYVRDCDCDFQNINIDPATGVISLEYDGNKLVTIFVESTKLR